MTLFLLLALVASPPKPLPVSAHNCYVPGRADNPRLAEALALGIDNIEIDLGWDAKGKRLIVGHDAAPVEGVSYPEFVSSFVPAFEKQLKAHPEAGEAPTVLTIDWKTGEPDAVRAFAAFLDAHAEWFSTAQKPADPEAPATPLETRRLTVCFSGSVIAKDLYDASVPAGGTYRAFRDSVFGASERPRADPAAYAKSPATSYWRFLTLHWGAVEAGGPFAAADWTAAEAERLAAIVSNAHRQGFRLRIYCLNGHSGIPLSGYRFQSDEAAAVRWRAAEAAGVDWIASDEYAEIVGALKDSKR